MRYAVGTYLLLVSIVLFKNKKIPAFHFPHPNSYEVVGADNSCLDLTNQYIELLGLSLPGGVGGEECLEKIAKMPRVLSSLGVSGIDTSIC